jgi:hypothetical protein
LQQLGDKMAYTIIRPGGLKSEAATGNGVLTSDASVCGSITREDVANVVIKALLSNKTDNQVRLAAGAAWQLSRVRGAPKPVYCCCSACVLHARSLSWTCGAGSSYTVEILMF